MLLAWAGPNSNTDKSYQIYFVGNHVELYYIKAANTQFLIRHSYREKITDSLFPENIYILYDFSWHVYALLYKTLFATKFVFLK